MTESGADSRSEQDVTQRAYDVMMGLWSGQLIYTAVELGMLDCLADGPKPAGQIARQCGSDSDRTYRLLRALGHHGVLEETADREFELTAIAECFLDGHPTSLRADLRFARSPEYISALLQLPTVIRDGAPDGFVREFDRGLYDYAEAHPEFEERVSNFMSARLQRSLDEILAMLESVDIETDAHLCDVGGGQGHLLARILESNPTLTGTVLDLPAVVSESDQLAATSRDSEGRLAYVGGDMFESVPTADVYVLKGILHNWDDKASVEILETVRESAPPDARLFVIEGIVPGPETRHYTKQLDMVMLGLMGGRERTEAEYVNLLREAGWAHTQTHSSPSGRLSILTAEKA